MKLEGKKHERLIDERIQELQKSDKIKILFIAGNKPMWKAQKLFELLNSNLRFEVRIIISPFARYSESEAISVVKELKEYFNSKNINAPSVIDNGFDINKWYNDFNPDILFVTQQYEGIHRNILDIEHNLDKLLCFIPYGIPTIKDLFVYNTDFHNLCWRFYLPSKLHFQYAKKVMANNANNVHVCGDPDADQFLFEPHKNPWKIINDNKTRKKIIWAPHFSISNNGFLHRASFLWLNEAMIHFAKKYEDEVQITFKPHPFLFQSLSEHKDWGEQKAKEYYNKWATMHNTQVEEGDFIDLFYHSDAMIHDCGSFTAEYLFTKKPVMFTTKDISEIKGHADPFGLKCLEMHEIGSEIFDIEKFILNIINMEDDKSSQREEFFNKYLLPPNNRTVAQNIYQDILNQ